MFSKARIAVPDQWTSTPEIYLEVTTTTWYRTHLLYSYCGQSYYGQYIGSSTATDIMNKVQQ